VRLVEKARKLEQKKREGEKLIDIWTVERPAVNGRIIRRMGMGWSIYPPLMTI
jgi:hypothetical protein